MTTYDDGIRDEDTEAFWMGRLAALVWLAKARPREAGFILDTAIRDFKGSSLYKGNRALQEALKAAR